MRSSGSSKMAEGAVPPRMLEPELEPAVGEPLEPVLRDGWPGHVAAEPLELSPVTPVDRLLAHRALGDARFGVRDLEAVVELAESAGLRFTERVEMPANNQTLVFVRAV